MPFATRSTVIAGALATAAIAAPTAFARPNLEPSPISQSHIGAAAPAVRPNPDQAAPQLSDVGPAVLHAMSASQLPEVHRQQAATAQAFAYRPSHSGSYSSASLNGYTGSPTTTVPAVVHLTTHSNPFEWGDAAIGAAGGIAISLLILGGAFVVTQRHQPEHNSQKALAG